MAEVSNAIFTTLVLCVLNLAAVLGAVWVANLLFAL
jgi:hypothetical protein